MLNKTKRPSAGTIIGTVALVFALTGAAVALPGKNKVNSGDIKNGQVNTVDLSKTAVAPKVKVQSASNTNSQNINASQTLGVLTKTVPAGKYAVSAKVQVFLNGDESMSCGLMVGATEVDRSMVNPPNAEAAQTLTIPLLGVATVPAGTPIEVECGYGPGNGGSVSERQLVATPAG
jgi:hypothetical protein